MRCDEIHSLLDLLMDEELPEELSLKLNRHLLRCPQCAYEFHTLEKTREMLQEVFPQTESSASFRERTSARLLDRLSYHFPNTTETESLRQWSLPFK